jgi:inorganic pyrophosphatase
MNEQFWGHLQNLVDKCEIVIDHSQGSTHPRYSGEKYPVDYGYLEGSTSIDSGGVDIWVGSLKNGEIVGILCTVDLLKKDTELKIILDCTDDEIRAIQSFVNTEQMQSLFIPKVKKEDRSGRDSG